MKKRPLLPGYLMLIIGFAFLSVSVARAEKEKTPPSSDGVTDYVTMVRNNQATGMISPHDYLRAVSQVQANQANRAGKAFDLNWQVMGPNNMGGRTRAILFDNRDNTGQTMFTGGVLGGMFRSDNGGAKWNKIDHEFTNMNVTCITQAGNGDIYVGTGEGFSVQEYAQFLKDWGYATGFIGQGIFKSTDGQTFELLQATKPALNGNNELEWGYINELAAHPSNGIVFASTNTGLKYSGDGGVSWQTAKTSEGEELGSVSQDIKMGSSGIIVAEVNNLCYVSLNGSPDNFMLRSGDSTYNLPAQGVGRIEFAIAPSNNDIIYALVVSPLGALVNVYRSDDKGETWIVVGPGGSVSFNIFNTGSNISAGVGLYAATIEVYPDDPYHILVGGLNMWEGTKIQDDGFYHWTLRSDTGYPWLFPIFLWQGHHVYKFKPGSNNICFVGTNGGISMGTLNPSIFQFQFMNRDYIASQFYTVAWTPAKYSLVGGAQDIGTIFIDGASNPADNKRGEAVWTTQANVPDGLSGGYAAVSTIYPTAFIYSRQPHAATETFIRRNEFSGGPDWAAAMMPSGFSSTAYLTPFLLFEDFEDYATKDSLEYKSTKDFPAGSTIWIESRNGKRPFKYTLPVSLSSGDSLMVPDYLTARFFVGGDDRVLMSKNVIQFDATPQFFTISNKATGGIEGTPTCMAHTSNANHLFVGTRQGQLYRISNIKYAYDQATADVTSPFCVISTKRIPVYLPGTQEEISQVITSVAVDPNNNNRVLITLGNYGNSHYVYLTDNALSEFPTFRSVQGNPDNGGLPQIPAYSSLIEMNPDNNIVMVGTEFGIYVTDNISSTSPTWVAENHNICRVPVFMLRQQPIRKGNDTLMFVNIDTTYVVYHGVDNYGVIYGATYGRGLIMLDNYQQPVGISEPGKKTTPDDLIIYPNPAKDKVTLAFENTAPGKLRVDIFNLSGMNVRSIDIGFRPEGKHEVIFNSASLTPGTYIVRVTDGNRSLSSKLIIN